MHFYVTIFVIPTENCKKKFFYKYNAMIFLPNCSKSARPKKFFLTHESPKPPLLKTMLGHSSQEQVDPGNQFTRASRSRKSMKNGSVLFFFKTLADDVNF